MRHKVWRDVTTLRRHQKQRHVTVTFKGIGVSMRADIDRYLRA